MPYDDEGHYTGNRCPVCGHALISDELPDVIDDGMDTELAHKTADAMVGLLESVFNKARGK